MITHLLRYTKSIQFLYIQNNIKSFPKFHVYHYNILLTFDNLLNF